MSWVLSWFAIVCLWKNSCKLISSSVWHVWQPAIEGEVSDSMLGVPSPSQDAHRGKQKYAKWYHIKVFLVCGRFVYCFVAFVTMEPRRHFFASGGLHTQSLHRVTRPQIWTWDQWMSSRWGEKILPWPRIEDHVVELYIQKFTLEQWTEMNETLKFTPQPKRFQ